MLCQAVIHAQIKVKKQILRKLILWYPDGTMKTKCYQYLRVSGQGQISGDGFPRQRETIGAYCTANNIEIAGEFVENGVSGTTDAFEREALSEMLLAIKASDVRLVIVETATRLARKLMVSEILLGEFRKLGVKVVSADSGIDLTADDDDPTKVLVRQVLGAISQFEKSCIVQKLRCARQRIKKANGKCEGRKLFGHTELERGTIVLIRDYSRQGMNATDISRRLNADGLKPRTATRAGRVCAWYPPMITRILARR